MTDNLDLVLSHLRARRSSSEALAAAERIASLNGDRVGLIQARDRALSVRKEQSALVGKLMREGADAGGPEVGEAKALSAEAAEEAAGIEAELDGIQVAVDGLLAGLPNLLDDRVPDGEDEAENDVVATWGDAADLPSELGWPEDFEPLWHDDVASGLGGWKAEQAVAMSGARFVALSGSVARLERAISSYLIDTHVTENGYTEVSVPYVVGRSALEGTSQLPKFEEDLFKITQGSHTCNGEDAFLIPTAEVPLTNLYSGQILEEADLPLSFVALTPCFRAEAGSYGRDTRGLIRTHQFAKVELVKITTAEASDEQHEVLTGHAEKCLEALRIPYRKVRLCSGDVGFPATATTSRRGCPPPGSTARSPPAATRATSRRGGWRSGIGLRRRPIPMRTRSRERRAARRRRRRSPSPSSATPSTAPASPSAGPWWPSSRTIKSPMVPSSSLKSSDHTWAALRF